MLYNAPLNVVVVPVCPCVLLPHFTGSARAECGACRRLGWRQVERVSGRWCVVLRRVLDNMLMAVCASSVVAQAFALSAPPGCSGTSSFYLSHTSNSTHVLSRLAALLCWHSCPFTHHPSTNTHTCTCTCAPRHFAFKQLIQRFYDPSSGSIVLDGVALPQIDRVFLHQSVAMVAQEPLVFADTIKNNIMFGVHRSVSQVRVRWGWTHAPGGMKSCTCVECPHVCDVPAHATYSHPFTALQSGISQPNNHCHCLVSLFLSPSHRSPAVSPVHSTLRNNRLRSRQPLSLRTPTTSSLLYPRATTAGWGSRASR